MTEMSMRGLRKGHFRLLHRSVHYDLISRSRPDAVYLAKAIKSQNDGVKLLPFLCVFMHSYQFHRTFC